MCDYKYHTFDQLITDYVVIFDVLMTSDRFTDLIEESYSLIEVVSSLFAFLVNFDESAYGNKYLQ